MILGSFLFNPDTLPSGMSLTVTPTPSSFFEVTSLEAGTTTGGVSVVASGGVAPYTYLWTSDNGQITINGSTTNSVNFNFSDLFIGNSQTAAVTCNVTDSLSNTGYVIVGVDIFRGS